MRGLKEVSQQRRKFPGACLVNDFHLHVGITASSASLVHKDHSSCTADMGWTAWALLIVSGEASDRPMYLTLPSSTSFFRAPIYKLHNVERFEEEKSVWHTYLHISVAVTDRKIHTNKKLGRVHLPTNPLQKGQLSYNTHECEKGFQLSYRKTHSSIQTLISRI